MKIDDFSIQKNAMEALKTNSISNPAEIGIAVKEGVVSLFGHVENNAEKLNVECAIKNVPGVVAIAENLKVGNSKADSLTDTDIAKSVTHAIQFHDSVKNGKIKIKVEGGIVKLEGEVDNAIQQSNLIKAVENLMGVKSVFNLTTIKPKITTKSILNSINSEFLKKAALDSSKIRVEVDGKWVKLFGKVRSIAEKEDAENAAWHTTGVSKVISHLEVVEHDFETQEYY